MKVIGKISTSIFLSKISIPKVESLIGNNFSVNPVVESINKDKLNIGAVNLQIKPYKNIREYINHVETYIKKASSLGCSVVAFPQYTGLLPLTILQGFEDIFEDFISCYNKYPLQAKALFEEFINILGAPLFECWYNVFSLLANKYSIYIHGGSSLFPTKQGIFNQSMIFDPDGNSICHQNKTTLSKIESDLGLSCGETVESVDTPIGKISTAIGDDQYSFQFFKIARNLGSRVIFSPELCSIKNNSMKDIRGAFMRAQETNSFAIRTSIIGSYAGFNLKSRAAIFAPYECTKHNDGCIAIGDTNDSEHFISSTIDLTTLNNINDSYTKDVNTDFYKQVWNEHLNKITYL